MRPFLFAYLPFLLTAAILMSSNAALFAAGEGWTDDFAAAKAQAEKEKKDILLDFTGSDWCGWCIKLDQEVFSKPEFKDYAAKHLVLVVVDFPHSKELPEKVKKQNAELQAKYGIEGYPTIVLLDSKGRVYARTGYEEGGAAAYVKHLESLRSKREKRDAGFAKAEKAKGMDRAKALDEALTALGAENLAGYETEIEEIIKLDADGKAGLKAKYESLKVDMAFKVLQATANERLSEKDYAGALKAVDDFMKAHKLNGEQTQKATYFKAVIAYYQGNAEQALTLLEEAVKLAPESELGKALATETISALKKELGK